MSSSHTKAFSLCSAQLVESEDGLPDGQREPGVQETYPPNQLQAAGDSDRDILPPFAPY